MRYSPVSLLSIALRSPCATWTASASLSPPPSWVAAWPPRRPSSCGPVGSSAVSTKGAAMSEPQSDPLDALRSPITPLAPDAAFAAELRGRLVRAAPVPNKKEHAMRTETSARPRNGIRSGDVSYITLGLPDLARGRAFYGAVLGWHFSPGSSEQGAQVDDIVPMMGLWGGEQPAGGQVHGAVLGFRVDDITSAVAAVRAHGGTVSDPHREPYAMAAEGHDDQGIPFYLHEMPSAVGDVIPGDG